VTPVATFFKLFWYVAKVVVVFGLLSSDVEFEISLETLCILVELMLFSLQVLALNHPILACFGVLRLL
jgi:hypothetical protein